MALEGLSIKDHKDYIDLMKRYEQLKIYYKIKYPLTHIKLYKFDFHNKKPIKYIGSANFSKSGFFHNQEILLKTEENFAELFNMIKDGSLLCTSDDIKRHIIFYEEDKKEPLVNPKKKDKETLTKIRPENDQLSTKPNNTYIKYKNIIIKRFEYAADADFKIPIIIKNDKLQDDKGINAWIRNQTPYLRQSNKFPFTNYFPSKKEFKIITDTNEVLTGKLTEEKPTQLELYPNIYEYLKRKLSLIEHRPITYKDLSRNNLLEIWVTKIDEETYYFDFSPKNVDRRRY